MANIAVASMLLPLAGMAGVVILVWLRLYHLRLSEMRRGRIDPQALALSTPKDSLLKDTRASDNFRNLFELPVLFFAGVLTVVVAQIQDQTFLAMAWAYVGLRAAHSLVQCSYNRVMHRFAVYALSSLILFAFWIRLGWMLAQ
jgi:hypothetical protein